MLAFGGLLYNSVRCRSFSLAHAAVYLASDEAAFVYGMVVDGGRGPVAVFTAG